MGFAAAGQRGRGRAVRHRSGTRFLASAGGSMTFADLAAGDAVFVDANTLPRVGKDLYHGGKVLLAHGIGIVFQL